MRERYTIKISGEEVNIFGVENLQQTYGLLLGQILSFKETFPDFRHFRRWWLARTGKQKKHEIVEGPNVVKIDIESRYS